MHMFTDYEEWENLKKLDIEKWIEGKKKEGKIRAIEAIIAPFTHEVWNPAKVAIFIPTGPGVSIEIAIMSESCLQVSQP